MELFYSLEDAKAYLLQEKLDQYIDIESASSDAAKTTSLPEKNLNNFFISHDIRDLARLHHCIRARRCFNVLEFGNGLSTVIMADALLKNCQDWENLQDKPVVRWTEPFTLHSVDASEEWVGKTRKSLPAHLAELVTLTYSAVEVGTFAERLCLNFECLPDVVPDFIYLDGPCILNVTGNFRGLGFNKTLDRTVIAADILMMEPTLVPGCFIVVDGRTNNARFLKNNLQRPFAVHEDRQADITTFELLETPLGPYNENQLRYCLGEDYFKRVDACER